MRITLRFKTPDVVDSMLDNLGLSDAERNAATDFLSRWIKYGEQISVAFDSDTETAEVLENIEISEVS